MVRCFVGLWLGGLVLWELLCGFVFAGCGFGGCFGGWFWVLICMFDLSVCLFWVGKLVCFVVFGLTILDLLFWIWLLGLGGCFEDLLWVCFGFIVLISFYCLGLFCLGGFCVHV